jgi:hypothetical protein
MRELSRRLAKVEELAAAKTGGSLVRLFFMPKDHADPEAFHRQCEADAGTAMAIVVRFVKPGGMSGRS